MAENCSEIPYVRAVLPINNRKNPKNSIKMGTGLECMTNSNLPVMNALTPRTCTPQMALE